MEKISIIIPFYNVEKYIRQSLESVEKQTFENIEVILVDDGSSDGSLEIAEEFVKQNDNFHLYRKENGGQGSARNLGMKYATGDYIMFLDSDDMLHHRACEILYKKAIETDSDITIGKPLRIYEDEAKTENIDYLRRWFNFDENKNFRDDYEYAVGFPPIWAKLYKQELIKDNNLEFLCVTGEDVPFTVQTYYYAKKITIINEVVYFYLMRKDENNKSTMQTFNSKMVEDRIIILRFIEEFCNENGLKDVKDECFNKINFINHMFINIEDENDRKRAYGFIKTYLESLDETDKNTVSNHLGFDCDSEDYEKFARKREKIAGKYRSFLINTKLGRLTRNIIDNTKIGKSAKGILRKILKV